MKLIAQLKLQPTPEQADALVRTMRAANAACDYISGVAWETRTFGKFALQKLCYETVREQFGLSAQMTVRALAKVGDAYKLDKRTKRTFRPLASIAYDDRILSFALPAATVSIWTLDGRQAIPFVCGERQQALLATRQGVSKRIVETAERTKRGIALEDLQGIRTRVRARRQQRAVLHSWSFHQLRAFISYKAARAGVKVVAVDPRNTSRRCPACGHTDKANRPTQATFRCVSCGCAGHADTIAAENIRVLGRAAVMQPHVSENARPSSQGQAHAR
jgi:IS605 OrfB family transposase